MPNHNATKKSSARPSPFFALLEDAESIQVREISPTTQPKIVNSVDEAVKRFDESTDADTRSFLVTVKKPIPAEQTASPKLKPKISKALPTAGESANPAIVIQQAKLLLQSRDYLLARNLFSYVLKNDLKNSEALKGLGMCLMYLSDTLSAKKCFLALKELYNCDESTAWLGICHNLEHNDELACTYFRQVLNPQNLPNTVRFNFFREFGNSLTRQGKLTEALENYHKALLIKPHSDAIHVNLGTLELQRHEFEKSAVHFERAVQIAPNNSKALCGLGLVAQIKGEKSIAEGYFDRALDIDCQNSVALIQLVSMARERTQWTKVKVRLLKLLIKEPTNLEMRFILATILYNECDWVAAEKELDFILAKNPNHEKATRLRNDLSLQRPV